jgi:hypothetical protein
VFENTGLPPETFIIAVLERYYIEKQSIVDIAKLYGVPKAVIVRIIDMYEFNRVNKKFIKKASSELDDVARKGSEKITDEDFKDLDLDIKLFERGKTDKKEGDEDE